MQFSRQGVAALSAVIPLVLCGTAVAGGDDDHGNPHGSPPGQTVAQQAPSNDTAPNGQGKAKGHDKQAAGPAPAGKAKGHSKTPEPAHPARPPKSHGHGAPSAPAAGNPTGHGPSGKTTICHATGSATNPYVTITISDNALPAHKRHQDGPDLIPAPAGGCLAAAPPATQGTQAPEAPANGHSKVTICHATGSATNPYVSITIAEPAVAAHEAHQDGKDIVPAPAEGCPGPDPVAVTGQKLATQPVAAIVNAAAPLVTAAAPLVVATARVAAQGEVLGETVSGGPTTTAGGGTTASRPVSQRAATAPATASRPVVLGSNTSGSSLPFTGLNLVLVIAVACGLMLAGFALRRSLSRQRTPA